MKRTVTIRVVYFAALAEAARREAETVETDAADLRAFYLERAAAHGIEWPIEHLRVALDGAFVDWTGTLHDGAEVAFIPPVSGG